jgi:hypothetical protein
LISSRQAYFGPTSPDFSARIYASDNIGYAKPTYFTQYD